MCQNRQMETATGRINTRFYQRLWSDVRLRHPDRFNTWPLMRRLAAASPRLEIGPGLCPRLPIEGTHFIDQSAPAVRTLAAAGGFALQGEIGRLPYASGRFAMAAAFDVIEHVEQDVEALRELSRVVRDGGTLVVSAPLHASRWTAFDAAVGHCRRYHPEELLARLRDAGFHPIQSAVYGMQPESKWLLDLGAWFLERRPRTAMAWYDRVFLPMGLRFQKRLLLQDGVIDMSGPSEVLLVCRRQQAQAFSGSAPAG